MAPARPPHSAAADHAIQPAHNEKDDSSAG